MAARHCLCDHARLYLRHGAHVDARSAREETALSILCGQAPGAGEGCLQLCRLLAAHGADIDARDETWRNPLHKACGAANASLARFLLQRRADVNAIDYNGISPLGCALQSAAFKRELRPHLAVQLLLNHGSQKIWPPAFIKVPTPNSPYTSPSTWDFGVVMLWEIKKQGVGRIWESLPVQAGRGAMASGLVMVPGMMETKTLTEGGSREKQAGQGKGHDGSSTGRGDWQGGFFPAWKCQR